MNLVNEGVLPPNEPDDRDERREEREMAQERKTLADVLAEYRNDADAMDRGKLYQPTTEYVRRLLDRIEAAWKRESRAIATEHAVLPAVCITKPSGNAAAIRKALVEAIGETCAGCKRDCDDCMNLKSGWMKKAKAALSAPARNCDVGTAEEQGERCMAQFDQWRSKGGGKKLITAIMEWAQTPYEDEEGGAK